MEENFNIDELTNDFKDWVENRIKNWNKDELEYVAKYSDPNSYLNTGLKFDPDSVITPDEILDPNIIVYFIDEYPQYSLKDIFSNHDKFLNLIVDACKKALSKF